MTAEIQGLKGELYAAGRDRKEDGGIAEAPPVDESDDASGAAELYDIGDDPSDDEDADDAEDDDDEE